MDKKQAKIIIDQIFDYIDGTTTYNEEKHFIEGHPALFFIHSKEELETKINEFVNSKDTFDEYDIYYFVNKMIKFLLLTYDSHTRVIFRKLGRLPIEFKYIDSDIYITNISESMTYARYKKLVAINGIDIKTIIKDIEAMTCYSTKEFLQIMIEEDIKTTNILKSLPCFNKETDTISYTIEGNNGLEDITFSIHHLKHHNYKIEQKENYTFDDSKIKDGILILNYTSCSDFDGMRKFIEEISQITKEHNITKFIIDLRGNMGGNSEIIKPLIEFLKGKEIVTLTNERIFSSGRMACINLQKIGSYFIGTEISTTSSAFGNIPDSLELEDLNLSVRRSTKYFHYDSNYNGSSSDKTNFKEHYPTPEYFQSLDPLYFTPDELVYKTIEDYINNNDPQLEAAINHLKRKNKQI